MTWKATFKIAFVTDTLVLLIDQDGERSVTNDAQGVIDRLKADIGELGQRRIYYRDTAGRFDELRVVDGCFQGFAPCSSHQQEVFSEWSLENSWS